MPGNRAQYLWYMTGIIFFVVPGGIQTIVFPWLIAVELALGADDLGIAQMFMQLPALGLILLGGLLADRMDPRRILIFFQFAAALPALGLALAIGNDLLSYGAMIAYALATGVMTAFLQPARDALLSRVAVNNLQQTVTVAMGLTFGAQIIGFGIASVAETTCAVPLLAIQCLGMLLSGAAATRLLPSAVVANPASAGQSGIQQIRAGLGVVRRSDRMRPAVILLTTMSMFYGGTFMVLNPIIVRDIYGGDAAMISSSFAAFMGGTISMTVLLVVVGGLARPGRGLITAIVAGGVCLLVASRALPFAGYLLCLFAWGMGGAVAMSMSRTIMQESAPVEYRARVMSVFSLANMGGLPIGAVLMGQVAANFGPLAGLVVAAVCAMTVGASTGMLSVLWKLDQMALSEGP